MQRLPLSAMKIEWMEILIKCQSESCVAGCEMERHECVTQVLQLNSLSLGVFGDAMRVLLESERGNFHNIMTNCGKTFLLKPLEIIFRTFTNPANAKYAWVGADQAEVIALQDFQWSSELICWKDLLILLEGEM